MGINKGVKSISDSEYFFFPRNQCFFHLDLTEKKIPALISVCSWLDCTSSGSLLNAIRSGLFLWSSADFTLQGLQPGLDLFCRSTQLAHYVSTSTRSRKILLLNLGLTASLLLGCGVGFGG